MFKEILNGLFIRICAKERSNNGPEVCREEARGESRKRGGVTGNVGKCGTVEMNCE